MSNKSKLFEEELARRNPDWEKIVAVHNAALAAEREEFVELEELYRGVCQDYYAAKIETEKAQKQLAAVQEKVKELEEELNEAVKLLKLEDIDAAIAKIGGN